MRQLAAFSMLLNYTQIAVHRPDQPDFPELWADGDVARGWIAQDGHAVFGVEDHDGLAAITVWLSDNPMPDPDHPTIHVRYDGLVLTTPIGDEHRLEIPSGHYALEFEHRFDGEDRLHARLVLHPT
jgi:Competence protein J (ComJ)